MNNNNIKPRLQWVDTAKGICILLVILAHTTQNIYYNYPHVSDMLSASRMPLYYTIAGFFVKVRNPREFIVKKINRLIVPYCFFILLGNIFGFFDSIKCNIAYKYFSPLYFAISEDKEFKFHNIPIWFLVALFNVYIMFMIIDIIAKKMHANIILVKILSGCFLGLCGFFCHRTGFDIRCFIDSSLTAMPFFMFGHLIMTETNLFRTHNSQCKELFAAVCLILIATIFAKGSISYHTNNMCTSFPRIYVIGIIGVTCILFLSKAIGYIPIVNKIGQYSIVFLGTHTLFYRHVRWIVELFLCINNKILEDLTIFSIVIILSSITCYIMLKFVPYLIAQKDFIYFKDNKEN